MAKGGGGGGIGTSFNAQRLGNLVDILGDLRDILKISIKISENIR